MQASGFIMAKIADYESPISGNLIFEELIEKKSPPTNVDEVHAKYQADLVYFTLKDYMTPVEQIITQHIQTDGLNVQLDLVYQS